MSQKNRRAAPGDTRTALQGDDLLGGDHALNTECAPSYQRFRVIDDHCLVVGTRQNKYPPTKPSQAQIKRAIDFGAPDGFRRDDGGENGGQS